MACLFCHYWHRLFPFFEGPPPKHDCLYEQTPKEAVA